MALTGSQITWHYTVAGSVAAQPDPNQSIGGFRSTTLWADAGPLFDVITGDENAASVVDYRCVAIRQPVAAETAFASKIYIASQDVGGATLAIGLATEGKVSDAVSGAARLANELAVPAGVSFSAPTTKATGLDVGDLAANQMICLWIRRTAANSAAVNADNFTLAFAFDSGA